MFSKAQIALLRKELSEKAMPKPEASILSLYFTQVQQRLQQQEEKEQQHQLKENELQQQLKEKEQKLKEKEELLVEEMEQQRNKKYQKPRFDGEA